MVNFKSFNRIQFLSLISVLAGIAMTATNLAYAVTELEIEPLLIKIKTNFNVENGSSTSHSPVQSPSSHAVDSQSEVETETKNLQDGNGDNTRTTLSGEVFVSVPTDPILGEGWQDPRGIIW